MPRSRDHVWNTLKKRSTGFYFEAKEFPNLNLLPGSSPRSFSRPESNVYQSWLQVDLCPHVHVA